MRQAQLAPAADALIASAVSTSQPTAGRVSALQQLLEALRQQAAQQVVLGQLQRLWPPLLQLLWDPQPAVCAAAAPVVGAVGALAAQATAVSGPAAVTGSGAGGLLFDWLLPVLSARAVPSGKALAPPALAACLAALRDCLAGVDAVTLARYATTTLEACQAVLEDEATTPEALLPLLQALAAAARHQHSMRARFQDIVDLMLGWAMDPGLTAAARWARQDTAVLHA